MYEAFKEGQRKWDSEKKQYVRIIYVRNVIDVQPITEKYYRGIYGIYYDDAVKGRLRDYE